MLSQNQNQNQNQAQNQIKNKTNITPHAYSKIEPLPPGFTKHHFYFYDEYSIEVNGVEVFSSIYWGETTSMFQEYSEEEVMQGETIELFGLIKTK